MNPEIFLWPIETSLVWRVAEKLSTTEMSRPSRAGSPKSRGIRNTENKKVEHIDNNNKFFNPYPLPAPRVPTFTF